MTKNVELEIKRIAETYECEESIVINLLNEGFTLEEAEEIIEAVEY